MVMLSPGVRTRELDFSAYVASISTAILGCVGGATKGTVDEPVFVSSVADYERKLGKPDPDALSTYGVLEFLREGNQLWYTRVADGSEAESSITIEDDEETSADLLEFEAVSPGTWGDLIKVHITDVSDKKFKLTVEYDGRDVEQYHCSIDDDDENYVEDEVTGSDFITVDDKQEGEGDSIESGSFALTGGNNGLDSLDEDDIESGLEVFSNQEMYDINILMADLSNYGKVASKIISICENRGDCIGLIDPPMELDASEVVEWHNGEGGETGDPSSALNSSYAATYWSWLEVSDSYHGGTIWIPPSGFIAGRYAYTDNVSYPWFASAGHRRGRLTRALDVEHSPDKGQRDLLYGDGNAVNPIVNFRGEGITVWGQRTLQRQPTALDRVNVRRMMLMVRKAIASSTRYLVFEPNDPKTWNEWLGMVNPYLSSIKEARGMSEFRAKMDEDTVTDADINANRMPGQVMIQPNSASEFITIDFALYPVGAEFPS